MLKTFDAMVAAVDFFEGSTDLDRASNHNSGAYEIEINDVWVVDAEQVKKMSIGEFVGGVAFALASRGDIPVDTASPTDVANVCFEIGRRIQAQTTELINRMTDEN